jgi:hypothetical protein
MPIVASVSKIFAALDALVVSISTTMPPYFGMSRNRSVEFPVAELEIEIETSV